MFVQTLLSSIKARANTDFPHPGPAETQRSLETLLSRHSKNLSSLKNHSQVPGTLVETKSLSLL